MVCCEGQCNRVLVYGVYSEKILSKLPRIYYNITVVIL